VKLAPKNTMPNTRMKMSWLRDSWEYPCICAHSRCDRQGRNTANPSSGPHRCLLIDSVPVYPYTLAASSSLASHLFLDCLLTIYRLTSVSRGCASRTHPATWSPGAHQLLTPPSSQHSCLLCQEAVVIL
jgi:hypothetical protein